MTQEISPAFVDPLADLASRQVQIEAAHRAQGVFARVFRLAADPAGGIQPLAEARQQCHDWCRAGATPDAQALRLGLLLTGLDQWGVAFSQAFEIAAIPPLTMLIGDLRTVLDTAAEARFQRHFEQIEVDEAAAIDFKIELRRAIHMALWHAMSAGADLAAAQPVLQTLGSLLVSLDARMPTLGWRLVADTLAHVQIGLLGHPELPTLARTGTQALLQALRDTLAQARYERIMAHATRALLDWQQARAATRQ
ncbi:hypothetical protein [Castellaniella caeni]|uniref:hypothetical protein n=1 Tax=Castellaniella caeni TaxID=266123 RepID=UPI00082D6C9E|nr:hypothetical protein [Castellaniella caeni]